MSVYNTDFKTGEMRFWKTIGVTEIAIHSPGYKSDYALKTTSRSEWWGSMSQDLNKDCLIEGEKFTVSAMVLLLDQNEAIHEYDATAVWG